MIINENRVKRKVHLKHIPVKKKELSLSKDVLEKADQIPFHEAGPELTADQQAILFICQRGHQSFISILQGVNSTRIPIGKSPLKEAELHSVLNDLEDQGYLSTTEIHDQQTWTATEKAKALEG